jgi:putative hemolysin
MSLLIQSPPALLLRSGTLEIKLASSFAEIDAVLRLRFEVFNLELQQGLRASWERGFDTDAYDTYCDHLIARDLTSGQVVGAYRLLRQSRAERHIGFYSENEFDLTELKKLPGELLELGRSCVAWSHRSAGVIGHLWSAIIEYARQRNIRWLFGCGTLHSAELPEVEAIWAYLRDHHAAPPEYRVRPLSSCRMVINEEAAMSGEPRRLLRRLPPVIKGYLRAGAMICGGPAYDAEFGTADVLALLDLDNYTSRYSNHYQSAAPVIRFEFRLHNSDLGAAE